MTFEEKVRFIRRLAKFKVIPISEVKAIAFAAEEKSQAEPDDLILSQTTRKTLITLTPQDIEKIVRVYPDLEAKLQN